MAKFLNFNDGSGDEGDSHSFSINKSFASKYDERKRAEELTLLKEKYGDVLPDSLDSSRISRIATAIKAGKAPETLGLSDDDDYSSSSSEDEDEEGAQVTAAVDAQIMRTIQAIRSKDTSVYSADTTFFDPATMSQAEASWKSALKDNKTPKPIRMKDMQRKAILENDGMSEEDDDEDSSRPRTHAEEQEKLRVALKKAAFAGDDGADDDDEDLFVKRDKTEAEEEAEEEDYKHFLLESMASSKSGKEEFERWQNYKEDPSVTTDEAFLMDYILNRGWVDAESKAVPSYDDIVGDTRVPLDEDEEHVDAAEEFETKYNFRFEEAGADSVITYSRTIGDSVRRPDNRRKLARQTLTSRKEDEAAQRREELKRLKNLKRTEIMEKLRQIKEITGNDVVGIEDVDLDTDFDPEAHDGQMASAFNDQYYESEQAGVKPEFDDDIDIDDILGTVEDSSVADPTANAVDDDTGVPLSKKEQKRRKKEAKIARKRAEEGDNGDEDNFNMDADFLPEALATANPPTKSDSVRDRLRNGKQNIAKKDFNQYLDEFYQLDYEDTIGDLPTRFRYAQVDPSTFGLAPAEILLADDKDLNQHISIKRLAPFRPPELQRKYAEKYGKNYRVKKFQRQLEERQLETDAERKKRHYKEDHPKDKKSKKAKKSKSD